MSSTLALRSHTPFTVPIASSHPILRKSSIFSTISSTLTLTLGPDPSLHYGPSLRRGRRPPPETTPASESGDGTIERARFSRAFDVAALRVPAEDCSTLESRLRGHLLNWPRIRNVARVPGDDLEPEFKRIMRDAAGDGGERLNSLALRGSGGLHSDGEMEVLSPVLYRDKLAKDFNCRGFVRFRNLAKISRPKSKKKKSNEGESEGSRVKERVGNNDLYLVEVVGDGGAGEEEDLSGLLGDDFQGGSWRGPTRLLLLDERYAKKGVEELPEAVKVAAVFQDVNRQSSPRLSELVQCRLILFYNYWQMNELLEDMLPEDMVVPTGFETVGHIAHLNLRDEHLPYKKLIAQVILDKNKPKIQTVVNKTDAIQNDYRTMQLEILVGNHSLVTTVIENGIHFQVDLATVYWNSRLATERQRLINCFASSDVVCDVFSGVGPVAISAAKKVKHVFANDLNPSAVEYLERNIVHNKLERKIEVFNMEGRRFIGSMFAVQRPYYSITQVVMNLPSEAAEFLDAFRGIFRKRSSGNSCTLPKIHVYGFSKAQNPEFDFHERINMALGEEVVGIEMRRVRLVAPGKWMLCASFILPQAVAFAKPRGH